MGAAHRNGADQPLTDFGRALRGRIPMELQKLSQLKWPVVRFMLGVSISYLTMGTETKND